MKSPVLDAIELLQSGRINEARSRLGIDDSFMPEGVFITRLSSLATALQMLKGNRLSEALSHLDNALPLVEVCNDSEAKVLLPTVRKFAAAVTQLHSGDAHGALQSLEEVVPFLEHLSNLLPYLRKFTYSVKATAYVALGRASLNGSDLESAERSFGRAEDQLRELQQLLNPNDPDDVVGYAEAYGLPLEFSSLLAFQELQALDTTKAADRLTVCDDKIEPMDRIIPKLPDGQLRDVCEAVLIVARVMCQLVPIAGKVLFGGNILKKDEAEQLNELFPKLAKARELAKRSGQRGVGYIWLANQLTRFTRNLLAMQIDKSQFGRYGGVVSFLTFVVLLAVIHLTIKPPADFGLLYFFGSLILSLIVGFGYSAGRFIPLLRLYKDALKGDSEKGT